MTKKVAILGGGVAGMSAAHELIERGFEVEVYEKQPHYVGGKARSVDYFGEAQDPYLKPLPGEHGFRFFPGFYRHIVDTMQRTPFIDSDGSKKTCFDNLVFSETAMMASFDKPPLVTLVNFPKSLKDLKIILSDFVEAPQVTGLTHEDAEFFAQKLWTLATSSYQRRKSEYERISWWEYTDADNKSEAYQTYFVGGLTRTLVAAKAKEVSTKTGGDILLQLLFLMGSPKTHADRVLNKPTNEAWLYPWRDYLLEKGVTYFHHHEVTHISCVNGKISSATVKDKEGNEKQVLADYFISCVPVERMNELLTKEILDADPVLKGIQNLTNDVSWMTGIQFYLNKDVKLNKGHTIYTDSPWALTSISQLQFWTNYTIEDRGNGKIRGVFSVDISDWFTEGLNGKQASQCTSKDEVKDEVWAELKRSLNVDGQVVLTDDMLEDYYLDRDIGFQKNMATTNEEPLLVNKINTWTFRPNAYTNIPNFFLASDYVRTNTDLATMEGANEAARRAVNAILNYENYSGKYCEIWDLHEPDILHVYRWYDLTRFRKGLPWKVGKDGKLPFPYNIINWCNIAWVSFKDILGIL
ncbi:MAG: phytoene dehydrogenase [Flexibacter sp. CG_4_10_14_3_um_filter_32_15]|nr:MAG: phytoene dehydrogenase [Flexibacter sp. CG_4_10_14_3_um_filter_32_15]